MIREVILENDKVQLDFSGVTLISSAFADECIGKIVSQYGVGFLKNKVSFVNTNDNIVTILLLILNQKVAPRN